jgi:DNA-directed RNA polymerase specialized sigma24 family protein
MPEITKIKRKEAVNIGSVSVDLHKKERQYDAKYQTDVPLGVKAFLMDYELLDRQAYENSDFDALITFIDGQRAVEDAKLTPKQQAAIEMTFIEGFTQEEVAELLGLAGRPGVNNLLKRGLVRVAENEGYDAEARAEWVAAVYGTKRENIIR